MIASKNKQFNQYIMGLLKAGWTLDKKGKHSKLFTPDGRLAAVVSYTPSDGKRGLLNLKAAIRRRVYG